MTDFSATRARFHIPEGMIYLDGNSLGPLQPHVARAVAAMIASEWGEMVISGWNRAGWMAQPGRVGDRIARLIGAPAGSVSVGDTLSIKVWQAVAAALALRPDRRVILSDTGNFPTDLYMAEGLARLLGDGHSLRTVSPEAVADALDDTVAVLLLTEVDYRTGRLHDMARLTARAQAAGALTVWDLAHSAGAIPVDVTGAGADFAVGCTYKYLNAGPGAPAFIHVAPRHADAARPVLCGWLGHAAPFAFEPDYRPAPGVERMRVGTPPVIQLAALEEALKVWDLVSIHDIRARAIDLMQAFIADVEAGCPDLILASPRDPAARGSQVSFRHPEGYAIIQALIARGVVGDFRAPDILRFGFTPLYLCLDDVRRAAEILCEVMATRAWDTDAFRARAAVT
ncbi:MAG: kynureninase [Alkalilacustris sp.]